LSDRQAEHGYNGPKFRLLQGLRDKADLKQRLLRYSAAAKLLLTFEKLQSAALA
jgi:hypothetical protein